MEQPPPLPEAQPELESLPPSPAPKAPGHPTMSLAARLLNVFAIPGDVFAEVKATVPSVGNWLAPALLLMLAGWAATWLIYSQPSIQQRTRELTDKAIEKQIEKSKMTAEEAAMSRKMARITAKVAPFTAPVFIGLVTPFGWGLILWLVGDKVFKGSFPFMKAVEVAGLANAVLVLANIVRTLLIVGLGNLFASSSPALLVKDFDPQNPSHSLMAVDIVMIIWLLTVRSIGLARLSGVPFVRAMVWVFGIWAAYTSLLLGLQQTAGAVLGG